jgi:aldehyde:ferredoxin oxidoreductase
MVVLCLSQAKGMVIIMAMKSKNNVLATYEYEPTAIERGYNNRSLYISVGGEYDPSGQDPLTHRVEGERSVIIGEKAVTGFMKEKFTGGKGFDLYHLWKSVNADTRWDAPENNIVISPGPLAGVTQYAGAGKSLVCCISPLTGLPIDSNVGGYFGPFLKFAGFDILELQGRAEEDIIIYINGNEHAISILTASDEASNSHILCEQLTEMFSENEADRENISVIASGQAAENSYIGVLNFTFWDKRRNCVRLKQAGRGGIGTVFRDKKIRAVVIRYKGVHGDLNNPPKKGLLNEAGVRFHKEMAQYDTKQNNMRKIGTANIIEVMDKYDLLPTHNYRYGAHPETPKIASKVFIEKYITQNVPDGCWFGCSMSCAKAADNFELRTGPYKGSKICADGPEYENAAGLGSNVGCFDPHWILEANFYCDTYGLDTISMATMTAFAQECYERGLINLDDTEGLDMRWGNGFAVNELMHQMAAGDGFGMIVGKGIRQQKRIFAERFGKAAPEYEHMLGGRRWKSIEEPVIDEPIPTAHFNKRLSDCEYLKNVGYDDEKTLRGIKGTMLENGGSNNDSAYVAHPMRWRKIEGIPVIRHEEIAGWPVGKPYYSNDPVCHYSNGRPWIKMTREQIAEMEDFGMENKGLEYSEYLMKESLAQQGGYALCNKGPQHDEAWLIFMDMVNNQLPTFEDKAEALHYFPMFRTWFGLLGLCKLPWNDITPINNKYEAEPAKIPEHVQNYFDIYEGVLGERHDEASMVLQSERVYTYQRIFILRMGSGQRKHDTPPARSLGPITLSEYLSREERYDSQLKDIIGVDPTGKSAGEKMEIIMKYRRDQFEKLVDAVYLRRGWTPDGIPKLEKLIEIGMELPELVQTVRPHLKTEGYWPTGEEFAKYEEM